MTPTSSGTTSSSFRIATELPRGISVARLIESHVAQLVLLPSPKLSAPENVFLAVGHAAGVALLVRSIESDWPVVIGGGIVAGLLLMLLWRTANIQSTWAAPLLLSYLVAFTRFLIVRFAPGSIGGYYDYLIPDWRLPLYFLPAALVASLIFSGAILAASIIGSRTITVIRLAQILLVVALAWAAIGYFGARTSGSAGSDPFAYLQMAIDLDRRGTPAHQFALFSQFVDLNLPWYPLVHTGYHLPMNRAGDAVSVWPPGGSVAFGVAILAGGERAAYFVNPLFSILTVVMSGLLAYELLDGRDRTSRLVVAAGTVALSATIKELVVWSGVTMVDSQAAFWSIAAVWSALRFRRGGLRWPMMAGLATGMAYDVRHTQLVLLVPVLVLLISARRSRTLLAASVAVALVSAFLIALPDLWYHRIYLGGWLHPESEELANYSLSFVGSSGAQLAQSFFAANEFGWLWPGIVCGTLLFAKWRPAILAMLAAWLILALVVHIPYSALRLRDLLPELPLFCFLAIYGAYEIVVRLSSSPRTFYRLLAGLTLLVLVELVALRVWYTVPSVLQAERPIFGYMSAAQRQSFNRLAGLVPKESVVGASLDSGPVELYAGFSTFRPADWAKSEREAFVNLMLTENRPVYILEDSAAVGIAVDDLRARFRVTEAAAIDVPLFGDSPVPHPGILWRVE